MYAVVELQGHQYIVEQGKKIIVDNLNLAQGESLKVDSVLAIFDADGKNIELGAPFIKNAQVECLVMETEKGEKIRVTKFKRKNRYQRIIGFRPLLTTLEVKTITTKSKEKPVKEPLESKATKVNGEGV